MSRLQENYQKIKIVGSGSFGHALLCRRKRDSRDVVIKVLAPRPREGRTKVMNEVKILKTLNHPNIIGFIEAWREGDKIYISMEYAEGGDLRTLIVNQKAKRELFSEPLIKSYMLQLACALYHIHSVHILHRDMKSENIFIAASGKVLKLGDFGISKQLTSSIDFAHTAIGTPYYMSPEIVTGRRYNAKSDIWAAGVILHEMITFEYPFRAVNQESLFHLIRMGKICKSTDCLKQSYSPDLLSLMSSMLEVDSKKRLSSRRILQHPALRVYKHLPQPDSKVIPKPAREPSGPAMDQEGLPNEPNAPNPSKDTIPVKARPSRVQINLGQPPATDEGSRCSRRSNFLLGSNLAKCLKPVTRQPPADPTGLARRNPPPRQLPTDHAHVTKKRDHLAVQDPTKHHTSHMTSNNRYEPTLFIRRREACSTKSDIEAHSKRAQREMDAINEKLRSIIARYPLLAERRSSGTNEPSLHRSRSEPITCAKRTEPMMPRSRSGPPRLDNDLSNQTKIASVGATLVVVCNLTFTERQFPRRQHHTGIDNIMMPILAKDMLASVMKTMTQTFEEIDAMSTDPNSQDDDFEDHMEELVAALPSFPSHHNLPGITKQDTIHTQAEGLFKFLETKITSETLCFLLQIIAKDPHARVHPEVLGVLTKDTTRYYCLLVQLAKYIKHTNIDQGRYHELRKER
eukprot:TRINITY_DN20203_c0_g1_i1.p1 TRINITY_DN20203_c0_g1~~TRINITY_DN20203_c0_g1_i1.p1  ORF type:complete len:685 (+),score=88.69 TRINITY_DN20203_c0_g1_i1:155-2209(+)